MHPEDKRSVIETRVSLEEELDKRLNVTDLIKDKIKNLTYEEKFSVLTTLYGRYYDYGRIMRSIRLMVADILMSNCNYTDVVKISDNVTKEYLSELFKANKITPFQAIAYANYHLGEQDQRDFFSANYNQFKFFKKGIHYFILKDTKPV